MDGEIDNVVSLKRTRGSHAQDIAELLKRMEKYMCSYANKDNVKCGLVNLAELFVKFENAHKQCLEVMTDDSACTMLVTHYDSVKKDLEEMRERVSQWFAGETAETGDAEETHSIAGSAASAASQAKYRSAQAKRAMAELEAKQLAERQEIDRLQEELRREREEAELNRRRIALEQQNKIDLAILEESMCKQAVDEENGTVSTPTNSSLLTPRAPVTQPVVQFQKTETKTSPAPMDDAIKRLAETLQGGFNLPKPEILTFDGNPANYRKFVTNFDANVININDTLKLNYLIQYCLGEAKSAIEDCVLLGASDGYERARNILHARYGRPHVVARSHIEKLIYGPQIKGSDVEGLSKLALEMSKCEMNLSQMGFSSDIDNFENLKRIVNRLPGYMITKWISVSSSISESGRFPKFSDLVKFVEKMSYEASSVFGLEFARKKESKVQAVTQKHSKGGRATTLSTQSEKTKQKYVCSCCRGPCSNLQYCNTFKALTLEERRKHVRKCRLCDNCFQGKHIAKSCRLDSGCTVPDCTYKHHTLMHRWSQGVVQSSLNCAATKGVSAKCAMGIVPVVVEGKNGLSCQTYAFLDNGADKSLCDEKLLKRLGIKGNPVTFNIATVNSKGVVTQGREIDLVVKPVDGDNRVQVSKAWSVKKLPISTSLAIEKNEINNWPHLNGVSIPEIDAQEVMLLIGIDAPGAHVPLEVRSGNEEEPYAVRTLLGWAVRGPTQTRKITNEAGVHFQRTDEELHVNLERLWKTDFSERFKTESSALSVEDKRALKQMESSVKLVDGHYSIGLPWRDQSTELPSSLPLAHARLQQLKKKLDRDEDLRSKYTDTVEDYITKGYAREVSEPEPKSKRTWYLPHHPVLNDNKPGKVRVVFDCAARCSGASLNSKLLQGPDLVNSLVGVLIRFRQEHIAIAADVEAMFHQVTVTPQDHDSLRFLWWHKGDTTKQPGHYCMQVHLFGATSSPSVAAYALKKTASDNADKFSDETITTVQRNFYVDDCLKSVETTDKAKRLVAELRALLSMGGFRLTKWLSNDKSVIASVPQSEREKTVVNLSLDDSLPSQRALGVQWDVENDAIGFKIKTEEKPCTRRGILSTVSALFDPLGLVSPVTLMAKSVLQELCRQKLGWDEAIPDHYKVLWRDWLDNLPKLENLKIRRCYKDQQTTAIKNSQLHIFSDASERGYGACAYIRITDQDDTVHCSLVMGKSRLAPIKQVSIPRLELSAAVVACRLYGLVDEALDLKIDSCHFWTDSTIVLGYIKNETRRFKTFVANRLTTIHDISTPEQWRHVDTKFNPADLASRGINASDVEGLQYWLNGPAFLWKDENFWPQSKEDHAIEESDEEVKREAVIATVTKSNKLDELIARYSNWHKLQRAVVWLQRFVIYLKQRHQKQQNPTVSKDVISVEEIINADKAIIAYVQRETFSEELSRLYDNKTVKTDSNLACLNPVIEDGLIRTAGRLEHSQLDKDAKRPIILPSRHHITSIIIRHYHKTNGHVGVNHVLAATREKFWIIKGRGMVRREIGNCMDCKRRNAVPMRQQMAPLPPKRMAVDKPPFTHVGVDYFGPIFVKVRRSRCKRYGCIFTCLTTRAVHIEIAHTLETDSFIACLQRFIGRRGHPESISSDNGTNLVGAERELRESLESLDQGKIHKVLLPKAIEWHFNPPHASHMGGVWERMIRSTRSILRAVAGEQVLTDESLLTFVAEAERILNDRPITHVSSDCKDYEPLTPNHLLLMRSNSCVPYGTFDKNDVYAKRRWRQVMYLANVFWRRWTREYLPALQVREKWQRPHRNVTEGDIVLVVGENMPRGQWPLGKVVTVNKGRDNIVRSCTVKSGQAIITRPVTKLCLLESAE